MTHSLLPLNLTKIRRSQDHCIIEHLKHPLCQDYDTLEIQPLWGAQLVLLQQ